MRNVADMAGACSEGLLAAETGVLEVKTMKSLPWFALRVREKMRVITEERVVHFVANVFSPTTSTVKQWSDRKKVIKTPVFPGYLFAQFEMDKRADVLKVLGIMDVVRVGNRPAEVDPDEIAALQRAFAAEIPVEPLEQLMPGQRVRVTAGPMRGVEGTLAVVKSEMKLVLAVTMMNRSVAVEIDQAHVMPVE